MSTRSWRPLPSCLRSCSVPAPHRPKDPNLGKPMTPPRSRPGTSAFSRTVPACRRAAARPLKAPRSLLAKCALCHGQDGKGGAHKPHAAGRRRPDNRHLGGGEDHRQFLALSHHRLRLHPAGDAMAAADDAHQ